MKKILILLVLGISTSALAHSGGTDSSGCHHDHKRGSYHCHKSDGTMVTDQNNRNPASTKEKKDLKTAKRNKKD